MEMGGSLFKIWKIFAISTWPKRSDEANSSPNQWSHSSLFLISYLSLSRQHQCFLTILSIFGNNNNLKSRSRTYTLHTWTWTIMKTKQMSNSTTAREKNTKWSWQLTEKTKNQARLKPSMRFFPDCPFQGSRKMGTSSFLRVYEKMLSPS